MTDMSLLDGIRLLESRTRITCWVIWAFMVAAVAEAFGELLEGSGAVNFDAPTFGPLALLVAIAYIGFLLIYLASIVFISMWIYRAHANLIAAGLDDLEYSPGWSVGWFFVPFANLYKPFAAMRELWNASSGANNSFGEESPHSVKLWWGCFIGGNILGNISFRMSMTGNPSATSASSVISALSNAILIVCAFMLMQIMREVLDAQRGHLNAASTFA